MVVDEDGKAVGGAEVKIPDQLTTTANGTFWFEKVATPANWCVVKPTKVGCFAGFQAFTPDPVRQHDTRIVLMRSETTHQFTASRRGNITLNNGSKVQIPANGLVKAMGEFIMAW